jgi:hypothetical protein
MKMQLRDPQTGRQVEMQMPEWNLLLGMVSAASEFRSLASVHVLAAMLANPQFEPTRQDGEEASDAYARRACDYADALLSELHRRQAQASGATNNPPSALSRDAATKQSL